MPFIEESTGYEKTILSDLQGAWSVLRDSVADAAGFEGWDRTIFHIDEAMSWESVHNLKQMLPLLLIIRNLCTQGNAAEDVLENIPLCIVNESVVRLGIVKGEYHWHKHDEEDEFFFTLNGELFLDIEGQETVLLKQHQGYVVPKGIVHKTRAPEKAVILMIETAGIIPTGDE